MKPHTTAEDLRVKQRLDRFAWLLDSSIPVPGTRVRFGLDPLLGIVPGIGDMLATLLSAYIVAEAWRLGIPKLTLMHMALNVTIESVLGTIPLAGDIFDIGWKANQRNVRLLHAHLDDPHRAARSSRLFLLALIVLLVGVLAAIVFLTALLLTWLSTVL